MSIGASQVTENVRPQVVIVTGKPACGKRVRMAQERLLQWRRPRHAKREYASGQDEIRSRPEDESVCRAPSYV